MIALTAEEKSLAKLDEAYVTWRVSYESSSLTKDEILDMVAYLQSGGKKDFPAFQQK